MKAVALTIAGFDCCAGAGLQADLKTFSSLGVHGLTAATCIVAETPLELTRIDPINAEMLTEQIRLLLSRYPISAVKTGMLYDSPQIEATARILEDCSLPIVVDPVMLASTGDSLLKSEALALFQEKILPLASVITPNRAEAEFLTGDVISDIPSAEKIAQELAKRYDCTCVLKGGHLDHTDGAIDLVATANEITRLHADWVDIPSTHGTGCTFAAAVAAGLAQGQTIIDAATKAKTFVTRALTHAHSWPQTDGQRLIALDQTHSPSLSF